MAVIITFENVALSLHHESADDIEAQLQHSYCEVAKVLGKFEEEGFGLIMSDDPIRVNMRTRFLGDAVELIFTPTLDGVQVVQAVRSLIVEKFTG